MPALQANGGTSKYCSKRLIFGKESHFIKSHIGKKVGWDLSFFKKSMGRVITLTVSCEKMFIAS